MQCKEALYRLNFKYLAEVAVNGRSDHHATVLQYGIESPVLRAIENLSADQIQAVASTNLSVIKCVLTESAIRDILLQDSTENASIVGFLHAHAPSLKTIRERAIKAGKP